MELKSIYRLKDLGVNEMNFVLRHKDRFKIKGQEKIVLDIYLVKIFSKLIEKYITPYFYNEKEITSDVKLYLDGYKELNNLEIALVYYYFDLFRKSFFKRSTKSKIEITFPKEVNDLESKYRTMEPKGKAFVEKVCIPNFGECDLYEPYKWNFNRLYLLNKVCKLKFNFMLRIILNDYREGSSANDLLQQAQNLKEQVIRLYNGELTIWNKSKEEETKEEKVFSIKRRTNEKVGQWKYGTRKETVRFLLEQEILIPSEMSRYELRWLVYLGLDDYIVNEQDRKLIPELLKEIESKYII